MHPGFVVYNPETLLKLREAVGPQIGANLDPSHLFWQGIDIVEAIKILGREQAIFHVHAKETYVDRGNVARQWRPRHEALRADPRSRMDVPDRWLRPRRADVARADKAPRAVDYDDVQVWSTKTCC